MKLAAPIHRRVKCGVRFDKGYSLTIHIFDIGDRKMGRNYTHYWANQTCEFYKQLGYTGESLDHIASNLFRKRGVRRGDNIYVITVTDGQLYLLGKLEASKICSVDEAAKDLNCKPEDLWEADDHIVASQATPIDFSLKVPLNITQSLRFIGDGTKKPLKFKSPTKLDQQTLRGVRELDSISAAALDKLLPSLQKVKLQR